MPRFQHQYNGESTLAQPASANTSNKHILDADTPINKTQSPPIRHERKDTPITTGINPTKDKFYLTSYTQPGTYAIYWAFLFGPEDKDASLRLRRFTAMRIYDSRRLMHKWTGMCDEVGLDTTGPAPFGRFKFCMVLDNGENQGDIALAEKIIRQHSKSDLQYNSSFEWATDAIQALLRQSYRLGRRWDPFLDWDTIQKVFRQKRYEMYDSVVATVQPHPHPLAVAIYDSTEEPCATRIFETKFPATEEAGARLFVELYNNEEHPKDPYWALTCGPFVTTLGIPVQALWRYYCWRHKDPKDTSGEPAKWVPCREGMKTATQPLLSGRLLTRMVIGKLVDTQAFATAMADGLNPIKTRAVETETSNCWYVKSAFEELRKTSGACIWAPALEGVDAQKFSREVFRWLQSNSNKGRLAEDDPRRDYIPTWDCFSQTEVFS
ncbi:hypothetical protein NA57DRAFT_58328 [Rhizodiscina lignyota]|uniref:Uncharacterized protein n=1 Tax=Rhizodiscina lignyota TaxID=1504668 RepID=A0A9P4IB14_9PEZI|nr:hypothetical protein NA57DRAFT_58328 [Rhizodiscina lignyota]